MSLNQSYHDSRNIGEIVQPGAIPPELTELKQWCVYRSKQDPRTKRKTKVPYWAKSPDTLAESNNPGTWDTHAAALHTVNDGRAEWLGLFLSEQNGLVFVDLDNCIRDDGTLEPHAAEILEKLPTHCHVSQSGRGLHFLAYGSIPRGFNNRKAGVEMYSTGRGIAIPEPLQVVGDFGAVTDCGDALLEIWEEYRTGKADDTSKPAAPVTMSMDAREVRERLGRRPKMQRLLNGDGSEYDSPSEARAALAFGACFYTDDAATIAEIILSSGIFREEHGPRERDRRAKLDAQNAVSNYNGARYDPNFTQHNAQAERETDHQDDGEVPEWRDPIPLTLNEGPAIDPRILPDSLRTYCEALAGEVQVPLDMVVTGALGTLSAAITGRFVVKHRWQEPLHIMAVNVALPGSRKSALMAALNGALYRFQKDQQHRDRLALAEWESVQRTLKRQQDSLEREPGKGQPTGEERDLQRRAAVEELHEHELKKPVITTLVVDDVTPEKVAWMLTEQPGVAVVAAESSYLENFYRYGDTPNFNVFLQGHAADSVSIHRRNGDDATVERACLALNIAIQPDSLKRMGGVQGFMERGGTARLLMTVPRDMVGTRLTGADVPQMPESLSQWWESIVLRMLERRASIVGTLALLMSPEATEAIDRFAAVCDQRAKAAGGDNPLRAWILKQAGASLRLAGLLHLIEHDHTEPISGITMQRGIALSEWYRAHAEVAFAMMDGTEEDQARTVWQALSEHGELEVSRSDLHVRLRGRSAFKRAKDLDEPLSILEEYGYIQLRKQETGQRGRPTVTIHLNPLALKPIESPGIVRMPERFTPRVVEVI